MTPHLHVGAEPPGGEHVHARTVGKETPVSMPTAPQEVLGDDPAPADVLHGYSATTRPGLVDEAVEDDAWLGRYAVLVGDPEPRLEQVRTTATRLEEARRAAGVVYTARIDGRLVDQVFPLDVVPRIVEAADWEHLAAGVVQRTRALEAFLQDVYAGEAAVVADGVVPPWLVTGSPGYAEHARRCVPGGGPRATVSGLDLLRDSDGTWRVLEDNLRVPSGLGYAIMNRDGLAAAVPELLAAAPPMLDPADAPRLLHDALRHAAPPRCPREDPSVVVLSDGPSNTAWFEHRLLAVRMGVPICTPGDLVADGERVVAHVPGGTGPGHSGAAREVPVDVIYRRVDESDLSSATAGDGTPLDVLLLRAAEAGVLALANAPGNGVADDKATYAYVRDMIRYYLAEEPVLADVPTWVLADPEAYAEVRHRLGELVVKPVHGAGGAGVVFGPELSPAALADLERAVAAAPHCYVAQQPVQFTTHPTLVAGGLAARHVDLRVFAFGAGDRGPTVAVPAPLTRVALREGSMVVNSSAGGGSKDTWVLRG